MSNDSTHFLLVGNAPYLNRGCEAIVRGTMAILERAFGKDLTITLATLGTADVVRAQAEREQDRRITHVPLSFVQRWSPSWWKKQLYRLMPDHAYTDTYINRIPDPAASPTRCALQIGGDNYSLDYGRPYTFMAMDRYLFSRDIPVVLWGASVGPFDQDPAFAENMFVHLRKIAAIFVREQESYDYLKARGVAANLHRMADPAFLMEPCQPHPDKIDCPIPEGAVGVNLSPLMARYVTGGDLKAWTSRCVDLVGCIVETTQRDVLLIPHVTGGKNCDFALLGEVARRCQRAASKSVSCVGEHLSAAETKWVISQCAVFAGARTHATIGALSSLVPTISLAYSRKARGLNQDIFGCQDFCLEPNDLVPRVIAHRVQFALEHAHEIRAKVAAALPGIREEAYRGGELLRRVIP